MNVKKKTIAIIQARMGSTRLPGKVLKLVLGRPLLAYLIERVKRAKAIDALVIATTTNALDDCLVDFCQKEGIPYFRGSEMDVLDRFAQAAKAFDANIIVRICSDCPLIDPAIIDAVISYYIAHLPTYAYVSNTLQRSYPRGMDVEVFSLQSLLKAAKEAKQPVEREHVTPYIYRHPERFNLANISYFEDMSHVRLTVDTQEDFLLIKELIHALYPQKSNCALLDILQELQKHPAWLNINAAIKQKEIF